jgi:glycerol-3-phosphate acyltransferase PlsX
VVTGARADVVVTDGFTGNVLLKGLEAALATLPEPAGARIAEAAGPRAAALLGVAGRVVVCHGAAGAEDIASGIGLAARLVRGQPAIGPDRVPALPSDPPSPADPAPPSGPAPLAEVQV